MQTAEKGCKKVIYLSNVYAAISIDTGLYIFLLLAATELILTHKSYEGKK